MLFDILSSWAISSTVSQSDREESRTASSISRNRPKLTRSSLHTEHLPVFAGLRSFSLSGGRDFTAAGLWLVVLSVHPAA